MLVIWIPPGLGSCQVDRNATDLHASPEAAASQEIIPPTSSHPSQSQAAATASSTLVPSATFAPTETVLPELGIGWMVYPTVSTDEPPVRSYTCPWLKMPGDLPHYTYEIIHTYPHDRRAYTQGLFFWNGNLYESTGRHGVSSLRKVDLSTGEILMQVDVPERYFAEGAAPFEDKIFQLTWKEQTGFIYNPETFELVGTFPYKTQGWGLTQDGQNLIRSSGSNILAFIDPLTLKTVEAVEVRNSDHAVKNLNELEYIRGEVWANIYLTSCVARIDPSSGRVLGWIDLHGLLSPEEEKTAEVPNGIAFDEQTGRIFVTGKYWPKLFEIEVVPSASN